MRKIDMHKEICVLCSTVLEWDDNADCTDEEYIYDQCDCCDDIFCVPCSKSFVRDDNEIYMQKVCLRCHNKYVKA